MSRQPHARRLPRTWKLCTDCGREYLGTTRSTVCDHPLCMAARSLRYVNESRARKRKEKTDGQD